MRTLSMMVILTVLAVILFSSSVSAQTLPYLDGYLFDPATDFNATPLINTQVKIYCYGQSAELGTASSNTAGYWVYPQQGVTPPLTLPPCSTHYLIKFSGYTFRWISDESGTYNVKDFGALGLGTDDTIPIRDAIYYVASQNGGKLLFPKGEYIVRKGFVLPSGISIEGVNGSIYSNCRITFTAENSDVNSKYLFKITGKTHGVNFSNIELRTTGMVSDPFYLSGSKAILATGEAPNSSIGLVLRDLTIQGFEKGIEVKGTDADKAWQLETVRVDHVRIIQNKTSIELSTHNTNWQISNSLIGAVKDGIGIDIKFAGIILIDNTFGSGAGPAEEIGTDNVSETFINIGGPHAVIKINNSQCEKFRNSIVVDKKVNGVPYVDYANPIMVTNSIFGDRLIFKTNVTYVSSGNSYMADNVQAWSANKPLEYLDKTPYTSYVTRNTSCAVPEQTCCLTGSPVTVSTPTTGSADNVRIYSTGDSFSTFNRFFCSNNTRGDFIVPEGSKRLYGGRSDTGFERNLGVGTLTPGAGMDQFPYLRILEVEGTDGKTPWLVLNRSGDTSGVNRRWGWGVAANGNLYLQDIGTANRLQIDTNGNIFPPTDNTGELGTNSNRWQKVRATVVQSGDLILSDKETGKQLYLIKEDENNIYFSDFRTGKEMMRLDRDGNLFIKGKIYEGSKIADGKSTNSVKQVRKRTKKRGVKKKR